MWQWFNSAFNCTAMAKGAFLAACDVSDCSHQLRKGAQDSAFPSSMIFCATVCHNCCGVRRAVRRRPT